MKAIRTLLVICLFGFLSCQAQTNTTTAKTIKEKKPIPGKEMNLLDEQTKIFGQTFDLMGAGKDNPLGNSTNYLALIENMDVPKELKQQLREIYQVYNLSLDPKKKDSLKLMANKMIRNAYAKSKNDIQQ